MFVARVTETSREGIATCSRIRIGLMDAYETTPKKLAALKRGFVLV